MKKILLIEDSELFYDLFRRIFKEHEVIWAGEGEKGLELFSKHKPDVVVVDLILPDMNGVQLIEKIRKMDKNAKIIALSGIERSEVIRDVMTAGANDYISKISGVGVFREKMEKYLKD